MLSEHWDLRIWLCVFLLRSTKSLFISRKTLKLIWIRLYNGPYQPTRISGNITSVELKLQCVRLFWTSFSFNFGFLSFFFRCTFFFLLAQKKNHPGIVWWLHPRLGIGGTMALAHTWYFLLYWSRRFGTGTYTLHAMGYWHSSRGWKGLDWKKGVGVNGVWWIGGCCSGQFFFEMLATYWGLPKQW